MVFEKCTDDYEGGRGVKKQPILKNALFEWPLSSNKMSINSLFLTVS